ncbi:MAG TPA: N-acetylmuramoyl-L-alanine amidase-like domain-containing protein [Longimicrobiales bacterium]|nr:N-acetylmuramoyl-L-alanine amidase-like domain-containing protein [Longimicrobiales bacterium]
MTPRSVTCAAVMAGALSALVAAPVPAVAQLSGSSWDDADWSVFHDKVRWALEARLDTLPLGETVAAMGRSFVGTAYVARTLEPEGPEHLVINFRGLDCVTFVETALSLARFVRLPEAAKLLEARVRAEDRYEELLAQVRYRAGLLDGYPSRLHYFSDWIADAQAKGLVTDVTPKLGGVIDSEAVDFMSTHAEAYRQLSDPENLAAIRATETRLTSQGRWYVPEEGLEAAASSIHNGDIIAATSTVAGLDVAHTGVALWVEGTLRLLHAPLVGDSVQVSEESLPQRIRRIPGQDGILVARPGWEW